MLPKRLDVGVGVLARVSVSTETCVDQPCALQQYFLCIRACFSSLFFQKDCQLVSA